MELIAERVIDLVSKDVIRDFIKEFVLSVYKDDPKIYKNDGTTFAEAWEWEEIKKTSSSISRKMFYNHEKTKSIPNAFDSIENIPYKGFGIHGSEHWKTSDVRELMPAIMNEDIKSSHPMTVDRPFKFWNKFISDYVKGGRLNSVINKHAKANGLKLG